MTTLVTGSTGFIGSALVDELRRRGDAVIETVKEARQPNDVVFDLRSQPPADLFNDVDQVVHLAGLSDRRAHSPAEFDEINHVATARLAQAAAAGGVRHFIWASSVFVHGDSPDTPIDVDSPMNPTDSYARSKRDAEVALAQVCKDSLDPSDASDSVPMQMSILRLPLVIATGIARQQLAERLVRTLPIIPVPSLPNQRSFVERETVTQLLVELLQTPDRSSTITIPSPDGATGFEAVLRSASELAGTSPRFVPIPPRIFATVDAVAKRAGRSSLAGLYTDLNVTGSSRPL